MSSSPSTSSETQSKIPGGRSRRFWLIAASLLVVFVIGFTTFAVIEARAKAEQARRFAAQAQPVIVGQRFANQQIAPAVTYTQGTQTQNPFATRPKYQNRQPSAVYYTQPAQPQHAHPQDPAEQTAAKEINQLRNELQSATSDEKKELRKSLTEAVAKLFDLRHAAQSKQVEKLESELAEAKELHKKRGERKDEIVERRIAELLQSADDLAWNREIASPPAPTTYNFAQDLRANQSYSAPPTGTYQVYPPSNAAPSWVPQNPLSLPPPQSSTPPQFIPLNTQDPEPTTLLKAARNSTESAASTSVPSALITEETFNNVAEANNNSSQIAAMVYCETNVSKGFFPIDAEGIVLPMQNLNPSDVSKYFQVYAKGVVPPSDAEMPFKDDRIKQVLPLIRELEPLRKKLSLKRILIEQRKSEPVFHIRIQTSNQRFADRYIEWGHAPGYEVPGEPTVSEKIKTLLQLGTDLNSDGTIDLTTPTTGNAADDLGPVTPKSGLTGNQVSESKAMTDSTSTSKPVIEAAYSYVEALATAIETKKLVAKGARSSRELSIATRSLAKAKAIWAGMLRDLAYRLKIKEQEYKSKQLVTIAVELQSIVETQKWVEDFKKQSIEPLEKQLEQTEDKKAEVTKIEAPSEPATLE